MFPVEAAKKALHIPVNVIIRPRGGDFYYNEQEVRGLRGLLTCRWK